jgi:hypothetical protein
LTPAGDVARIHEGAVVMEDSKRRAAPSTGARISGPPAAPEVDSRGLAAGDDGQSWAMRGVGTPPIVPAITLPKGGGAIRGMDEKLTVALATGSAPRRTADAGLRLAPGYPLP